MALPIKVTSEQLWNILDDKTKSGEWVVYDDVHLDERFVYTKEFGILRKLEYYIDNILVQTTKFFNGYAESTRITTCGSFEFQYSIVLVDRSKEYVIPQNGFTYFSKNDYWVSSQL